MKLPRFKSTRVLAAVILVSAAVFAVMGGEYSTPDWWRLKSAHRTEVDSIARLEVHVDSLSEALDKLLHDGKTQERVARERFGMIREGEVVYRLVEREERER